MKTIKEIDDRINKIRKEYSDLANKGKRRSERCIEILDWSKDKQEIHIDGKISGLRANKLEVTSRTSRNTYNRMISELMWVLDY